MRSFTEFYEEEETDKILEEGFASVLGNILGIGTTGVLTAWIAAMLFKGGVGAINSFAHTMGKDGIEFKKNFKSEKTSKAVLNQENKMVEERQKYAAQIGPILEYIKNKDWEKAAEEYNSLPVDKKNSTEIKRIIIEDCVKATNMIPISEPTPGNECYRAIKKMMGLATAKAIAKAIQDQAAKYVQQQGV